jgi:hypothetical protein
MFEDNGQCKLIQSEIDERPGTILTSIESLF